MVAEKRTYVYCEIVALFDTLKAAMRLRDEGGFDEPQAGAIVATVADAVGERLATKDDLQHLEQRVIVRIGMMLVATTGLLLAAIGIATGVIVSA